MVLQGAVVTTSDTANAISDITTYYFDIIEEHSIQLQNQITDNYLENNTAVQDHIAQSPITITLRGLSGEKVYTAAQARQDELNAYRTALRVSNTQTLTQKLGSLSILTPTVSNATQIAKNTYSYAQASISRYTGMVTKFFNINNPIDHNGTNIPIKGNKETRLEEIWRKLRLLRNSNTSFIVETPYGNFQDMYIQSLTLRQGNQNFITDIELTLKQLRFANVEVTGVNEAVRAAYNAYARADVENCGIAQGENTLLYERFGKPFNLHTKKSGG